MKILIINIVFGVLCFYSLISGVVWAKFPFQDTALAWDKRVDDLVNRLTLDELVSLSIAKYNVQPGSVPRLDVKPYRYITECLRGICDKNATAFPQALGLAATFDRRLLYQITTIISSEARAFYNADIKKGVYDKSGLTCFSPVINIMRHPLWGRSQESYGEDPYLSGELVTQYVKGLQGDHPRYVRAHAGCKHFDAYAGPENIPESRHTFNAVVSERDLRMTFFPQFKACVKAGTYNIMCSYNNVNGVPACVNNRLLMDVLRKEWNFEGFVISDDEALSFIVSIKHYLSNFTQVAAAAIKAGCNVELVEGGEVFKAIPDAIKSGMLTTKDVIESMRPVLNARMRLGEFDPPQTNLYFSLDAIPDAIKSGMLTMKDVIESMRPVLNARMRLGEFDPPQTNPYSSIDMSVVLSPAHREVAVQAASMSFVLLKNSNNLLPIKNLLTKVAILGPFANNAWELYGTYRPNPDAKFESTPYTSLQRLAKNATLAAGCNDTKCGGYDSQAVKQAVLGSDLIIICIGSGVFTESESNDRTTLDLPGHQKQLIEDSLTYNADAAILVLVFTAGPLDLAFIQTNDRVQAILQCFYPAMSGGEALYRTLTASSPHSVPAGRLPSTWPASLAQVSPITDYNMTNHQTYRYIDSDPLYPFGFGLSYSTFLYDHLSISPQQIKPGQNISVSVHVLNKGPYDADEVVQVYMSWGKAPIPAPRWTLVGFDRVMVKVNQPLNVTFTVTSEQMALWLDDKQGFVVLPGEMMVYVGGQQPHQKRDVGSNVLQAPFTITA